MDTINYSDDDDDNDNNKPQIGKCLVFFNGMKRWLIWWFNEKTNDGNEKRRNDRLVSSS